jgi:hypothetical protein
MAKELCDCIDKVNKSLQEEFEGVYVRNTTNIYTGYRKPIIAAERRHGKGKKAPPRHSIYWTRKKANRQMDKSILLTGTGPAKAERVGHFRI